MTISQTITEQWDDLSHQAQDHIRRTRPQLLRDWHLIEDGCHFETVEADSLSEAIAAARDVVDTSAYDTSDGTYYADIRVRNAVTGESDSFTLTIEPDEPECSDEHDHDWHSPYSVLGGIKENPGVWCHGGGVIIKECCAHCGRYKITDTWAQRADTGEQGLTEVTYEDADEDSRAWIAKRAKRQLLDALSEVLDVDNDWWHNDELRIPIDAESPVATIETAVKSAGWSVSVYSTDEMLYIERE